MSQFIDNIKQRIFANKEITFQEAIELSKIDEKEKLYAIANEIRQKFAGNNFDFCSIINAKSGKCPENCKWCSQSVFSDSKISEYEMIENNIAVEQAKRNEEYGIGKFSLVTSGKKLNKKELEKIINISKAIKKDSNIELCASMGLLNEEEFIELYKAGIQRYHCNLETASSYFSELCTSHTTEQKIETLKAAKKAGMEICSGGIIGMGETMEQRIELAFELKNIGVNSIPINVLNPIKGTKLENMSLLKDEDILTTFAIFRFIHPKAMIRFAGGRTLISHLQEKAVNSGINASIVGDLLTTSGFQIQEDMEIFKKSFI